jgi:hypothetical protein
LALTCVPRQAEVAGAGPRRFSSSAVMQPTLTGC